jgi:hypothetical protein
MEDACVCQFEQVFYNLHQFRASIILNYIHAMQNKSYNEPNTPTRRRYESVGFKIRI